MNNITILIIEDNRAEALLLEAALSGMEYTVCGTAASLKEALALFVQHNPDIVIADIMLNGKQDGIAFAETLGSSKQKKPLIFLTGYKDRATFEAARLTFPFSFLLKPFNALELQYAIELAIEQCAQRSGFAGREDASLLLDENLFVKKGNYLARIPVASIHYIEVIGKYCHINSPAGKFPVNMPLKELLGRLYRGHFLRIHRNFIINLNELRQLDLVNDEVVLSSGERIPASRRYKLDFIGKAKPLK
jgi:DNA-binding LytR/AlgR family response regulator